MGKLSPEEQAKNDQRTIEVWSSLVEHHGTVGDFSMPYIIGQLHENGVGADLRLSKGQEDGYVIYVNDFFGDPFDFKHAKKAQEKEACINMMVRLVNKLKLEGVNITWLNIQASDESKEPRGRINSQCDLPL